MAKRKANVVRKLSLREVSLVGAGMNQLASTMTRSGAPRCSASQAVETSESMAGG